MVSNHLEVSQHICFHKLAGLTSEVYNQFSWKHQPSDYTVFTLSICTVLFPVLNLCFFFLPQDSQRFAFELAVASKADLRMVSSIMLGRRFPKLFGFTDMDIQGLFPFMDKVLVESLKESGYMHIQATKPDTAGKDLGPVSTEFEAGKLQLATWDYFLLTDQKKWHTGPMCDLCVSRNWFQEQRFSNINLHDPLTLRAGYLQGLSSLG